MGDAADDMMFRELGSANLLFEMQKQKAGALACACIGPQGNDPLCPCRMKNRPKTKEDLK